MKYNSKIIIIIFLFLAVSCNLKLFPTIPEEKDPPNLIANCEKDTLNKYELKDSVKYRFDSIVDFSWGLGRKWKYYYYNASGSFEGQPVKAFYVSVTLIDTTDTTLSFHFIYPEFDSVLTYSRYKDPMLTDVGSYMPHTIATPLSVIDESTHRQILMDDSTYYASYSMSLMSSSVNTYTLYSTSLGTIFKRKKTSYDSWVIFASALLVEYQDSGFDYCSKIEEYNKKIVQPIY